MLATDSIFFYINAPTAVIGTIPLVLYLTVNLLQSLQEIFLCHCQLCLLCAALFIVYKHWVTVQRCNNCIHGLQTQYLDVCQGAFNTFHILKFNFKLFNFNGPDVTLRIYGILFQESLQRKTVTSQSVISVLLVK